MSPDMDIALHHYGATHIGLKQYPNIVTIRD